MKHKRSLTKEDRDLWRTVTRGIEPYHNDAVSLTTAHKTGVCAERPAMGRTPMRASASGGAKPPALQAGDPKLDRRAARGRIAIDATLDLHGLNQAAAHMALQQFLAHGRMRHFRCLLVITGKGANSSGSGILRRRFLEWVNEHGIREQISRAAPAHQRHGGAGAFYIFLKSPEGKRLTR